MSKSLRNFLFLFLSLVLLLLPNDSLASKARTLALQMDPSRLGLNGMGNRSQSRGFQEVPQKKPNLPLHLLQLPPGFEISIFAVVPHPRGLALGQNGQVFVGNRDENVFRITDRDLNGEADRVEVLLEGLNQPNGVAYRDGNLYVAEKNRLLKVEKANSESRRDLTTQKLAQDFPIENQNGWKFLRFGPDGWLYLNLPFPGEARFHRVNVQTEEGAFVGAAPPTVGFDWDPESQKLWVPSLRWKSSAQVAPLGVRFYTGKMFPPEYQNQILMAEQGSWNQSKPQGYRVSHVTVIDGKVLDTKPFVEGWLQNGRRWGQPIDVEVYFDGSLLISDDEAGVIYRILYLPR